MVEIKERPILFSSPMVRAILEGRKTQTRRVVNVRDLLQIRKGDATHYQGVRADGAVNHCLQEVGMAGMLQLCPYGKPGDRLWVRETHAIYGDRDQHVIHYRATHQNEGSGWKPSIHMPRWASRITLEVVSVRVERLQDISRADAIAEGVNWRDCPQRQSDSSFQAQLAAARIGMCAPFVTEIDYVGGFRQLWESINGPGSWGENPWVWVVEFRRQQ